MPFTTALVVGGLGAATGLMQARAQKKANEQQANISAAQTEFSPWTGQKVQEINLKPVDTMGSALIGGAGGGLSGYMQGLKNDEQKLKNQKLYFDMNPSQATPQANNGISPYSSYGNPEEASQAATSSWMTQPMSAKKTFYSQDPEMLKRMQGQV